MSHQNWSVTQKQVTAALKHLGFQVSVTKVVNGEEQSTMKAWGCWDINDKLNLAQGPSNLTGNQKQIYIAGTLKQAPVPGDLIKQGSDVWSVVEAEAYKPAALILAYRVVVN